MIFLIEIFWENHHPTRHIKYKIIIFARSNILINLPSTSSERFLRRIKSPLTLNSAKKIARLLSQIGRIGNLKTPIT